MVAANCHLLACPGHSLIWNMERVVSVCWYIFSLLIDWEIYTPNSQNKTLPMLELQSKSLGHCLGVFCSCACRLGHFCIAFPCHAEQRPPNLENTLFRFAACDSIYIYIIFSSKKTIAHPKPFASCVAAGFSGLLQGVNRNLIEGRRMLPNKINEESHHVFACPRGLFPGMEGDTAIFIYTSPVSLQDTLPSMNILPI